MLIFNSSKPDISTLVITGHFYFGLTQSCKRACVRFWVGLHSPSSFIKMRSVLHKSRNWVKRWEIVVVLPKLVKPLAEINS
jgi:hypothetical protein